VRCEFRVVFLLLQFCTYGQLLELKLLAFLSGTLHILLFIPAYCANKWWWWWWWYTAVPTNLHSPLDVTITTSLSPLVYGCLWMFAEPGAAFGEVALLSDNGSRSATIVADEPSDLVVIDRALYARCVQVLKSKFSRNLLAVKYRRKFLPKNSMKFREICITITNLWPNATNNRDSIIPCNKYVKYPTVLWR